MHTQALAIIESYVGQSFGSRQVNEVISLKSNIGRLTHGPIVRIDSLRVRSSEWAYSSVFGATEWAEIAPHDIILSGTYMVVPGGVLDAHYSEADVTYTIGFAELPAHIRQACELLSERLESLGAPSAYSASAHITPEIAALLQEVSGN